MELSVEKVNVDVERGTVIITGYDVDEIVSEVGATDLLKSMDYSDILDYVNDVEEEKRELDEDYKSSILGR